jgi:hypothetical protein
LDVGVRHFFTCRMSENTNMEQLSIPEFYKGRSVFITGATGFMGKVLVEKLLRSCPEVDRIYLLMRPSKGQSVECRLEDLINNQVRILNSYFIRIFTKVIFFIDIRRGQETRDKCIDKNCSRDRRCDPARIRFIGIRLESIDSKCFYRLQLCRYH